MNKNSENKFLITGAGGFLGTNLVDALSQLPGYRIYALSTHGNKLQQINKQENVQYYHKNDIFTDKDRLLLRDAIVVNCAFPRNTSGSEMADGLQYIQKLFDRLEECDAKAVVNISSQSVYSQTREGLAVETTPLSLESTYAVGKYATELMLESACKKSRIPYTNLRMASLIGPGFDQRIVNRLVKRAVAGEMIHVVRERKKFGFLDIEDAVRAIVKLINIDPSRWAPIYNIGNGKEYSVEYIAERIEHVFNEAGLPIPSIHIENGVSSGTTGVAYNKFHKDTDFNPLIDLDTSIRRILLEIQAQDRRE